MNFTGLRDYQVPHAKALSASLEIERAVLDGSDTGTGKTYVALTICKELDIVPFVITKLGVISGWNEASGAVGCPIEVVNYELVRYQKKMSRKNAAIHFGEMSDKQYERVERSYCKKLPNQWGQLKAVGKGSKWEWHRPPGLIIFDEVQECGGRSTINSKLLLAASRQAGRILSLSATAAESPLQLKALGHAMGLYDNYTTFLRQHACYVNNWNGWAFNPTSPKGKAAMKRIHKSIFPSKGSRMVKASIPGFPATTVSSMHIEDPTGKAEGLCDELKDLHDKYLDRAEEVADEILELEEKIEAALHSGQDESFVHELVKKIEWIRRSKRGEEILRYRQQLEILKIPSLVEIAQSYGDDVGVVIFLNFTESIDAFLKKLPHPCGRFDGKSLKTRDDDREAFCSDTLKYIVVQTQAGGAGVGLHSPKPRVTLISPCYSGKTTKQLLGRVNRDGGGYSDQYFVYFKDTTEEAVAKKADGKMNSIDILNDN